MKTSTRTLRLIAATAAALVLMTAVAQARPLTGNGPAEPSQNAPRPATPGTAPGRSTSANGGFDWTAAGVGAGTALLVVVIAGAAGITVRGRRRVALSS